MLSVLLWYTDSDYLYCIFKLLFENVDCTYQIWNIISDDIEVEFSIESDNWETYDEEIGLRSNTLCLELDVNTEIFNTEQKMQSEFGLLVKSVLGSNIESVSARLELGIVGKFFT